MSEKTNAFGDGYSPYFGDWVGENKLWLSPQEPARESDAAASIGTVAGGRFLTVNYTWAYEDKVQDGLLVIGVGEGDNAVKAVWVDSWHMLDAMMDCQGSTGQDGIIDVRGAYAAPPGPDWGWRIVLELIAKDQPPDSFKMLMYNIPPDAEGELAVESVFSKLPTSASGDSK